MKTFKRFLCAGVLLPVVATAGSLGGGILIPIPGPVHGGAGSLAVANTRTLGSITINTIAIDYYKDLTPAICASDFQNTKNFTSGGAISVAASTTKNYEIDAAALYRQYNGGLPISGVTCARIRVQTGGGDQPDSGNGSILQLDCNTPSVCSANAQNVVTFTYS